MKISTKDFLKQIQDLNLVDRSDLRNCLEELFKRQPVQYAGVIARALIDRQLLTEYQAKVILRGKGHLLCMRNYLIKEKIAKGGMGTVFLAEHRAMRRDVAMKVLSKKNAHDSKAILRFLVEVQTAAKLCHPNIAAAFDADQDHGHWFLASEYVEGEDFQQLVEQHGVLFPSVAIDLIQQAAKGLEFAHEAGVTHRDIKPSNLMLNREGKVKLLDLGLARQEAGADKTRITCAEVVMGTPHYMSPEQADRVDGADARSDIYSLGCTLFFLLTGQPPYDEKTVVRALIAHRDRAIPQLRDYRDDASPDLQLVLERMMAKDPQVRYQKMSEVIEDLDLMKAGERPRRARKGKHASPTSGRPRPIGGLNQKHADESAEYFLDDGESQASVPTWKIATENGTTSVDCVAGCPREEFSKSDPTAKPRGAMQRIAAGVTSMLSFLKL